MTGGAKRTDAEGRMLLPPGFIHVDADGLWTLAGCYGYAEGDTFGFDPLYHAPLTRLLDLFDRLGVRATFFVVGRDLEVAWKRERIQEIAARGHELANHSYRHPIGLERLSGDKVWREIGDTQAAIEQATGQRPVGFRSPGYDAGDRVLRACAELGLRYDGSLLPTPLAPALRLMAGRLRERVQRSDVQPNESSAASGAGSERNAAARAGGAQYGHFGLKLPRLKPEWVRPEPGQTPVLRLPLAVSPWLGIPLHASLGMQVGRGRTLRGLRAVASRGWPVTYLLHLMDAAAPDEIAGGLHPALASSRAFQTPLAARLEFLEHVLAEFERMTRVELTRDYVARTEPPSSRQPNSAAHG